MSIVNWLEWFQRLQALAHNGLTYAENQYCPETIAAQQEERTITKAKREVQTIQQPGYAGDRHLAVA